MHPLNSQNFGINGIGVYFNATGTKQVGYILKQLGTKQFLITADGVNSYVLKLARETATAATLPQGYFTVTADIQYSLRKITNTQAIDTNGVVHYWTLNQSINGSNVIYSVSGLTPNPVSNVSLITNTNSIVASWTASPVNTPGQTIVNYIVNYKTANAATWTLVGNTANTTETISGLTANVAYNVQIIPNGTFTTGNAVTGNSTTT